MSEAPNLPKTDPNAAQAEQDHVIELAAFRATAAAIEGMLVHADADDDQVAAGLCDSLIAKQIFKVGKAIGMAADQIVQPLQHTDLQPFRAKRVAEMAELLEILGRLCGVEVAIIPDSHDCAAE